MKVLRVISSMDPKAGGPPQGIRNILPELLKHGIQQEVVCMDSPDAEYLATESISIHALGPARTSWAYSHKLSGWLKKHLKDYDSVICHGLWQYPLLAVRREIQRLRKTGDAPDFYVYPHGMLDPWFQRETSRRIKALRNQIYWHLFEKKNLNLADALLYTCEEECRLASTTFAGYRAKEVVVGYGVPPPPAVSDEMRDAFLGACPTLQSEQPYLLFLSRIHPKKGVDLLIRAYAELVIQVSRNDNPQELPHLVIAGPLDSTHAEKMRMLAKELLPPTEHAIRNTLSKVHFPGMLQGDAKWGALHFSDAFILPSHQENFGIAVVEALSCGSPVLISDKVNIWREIQKGGGGLISNDTLSGIIDLLKRWVNLTAIEKQDLKACATQVYYRNFSIKQAADRLSSFLYLNCDS